MLADMRSMGVTEESLSMAVPYIISRIHRTELRVAFEVFGFTYY